MRASLTVSSHQIQRIGGMRSCRPTPRIETPRRAVFPHTAAGNIKLQDFTSQSGVSHNSAQKKSDENSHRSFCLFYLSILYVAYARICPFTKSQAFDITKSG